MPKPTERSIGLGYERFFAFLSLTSSYHLTNRLNLRKDVLLNVMFGGKGFEKARLETSINPSLQVDPNYYRHHALVDKINPDQP